MKKIGNQFKKLGKVKRIFTGQFWKNIFLSRAIKNAYSKLYLPTLILGGIFLVAWFFYQNVYNKASKKNEDEEEEEEEDSSSRTNVKKTRRELVEVKGLVNDIYESIAKMKRQKSFQADTLKWKSNLYKYISTFQSMSWKEKSKQRFRDNSGQLSSITSTGCIYLDYNATTPIFPEVTESMLPYIYNQFGNPSSSHCFGDTSRKTIMIARNNVASLVGASSANEIIFTSCGSESDNWAIIEGIRLGSEMKMICESDSVNRQDKTDRETNGYGEVGESNNLEQTIENENKKRKSPSSFLQNRFLKVSRKLSSTIEESTNKWPSSNRKPHVIMSSSEHPAVHNTVMALVKEEEITVSIIPVSKEGLVDAMDVINSINEDTVFITVMHANNETGAIQPIAEIAEGLRRRKEKNPSLHKIIFHSDAAQSIGKVPVKIEELHVDLLTIVGHKFGAPKGIAALYVRNDIAKIYPEDLSHRKHSHQIVSLKFRSFLHGGGQEHGYRAGTECTLLITALGTAARVVEEESQDLYLHLSIVTEYMKELLVEAFGAKHQVEGDAEIQQSIYFLGPKESAKKLPNTLMFILSGCPSNKLLPKLTNTVAISAGSACHSGSVKPSQVLTAMGIKPDEAACAYRISTGRHTTIEDVQNAMHIFISTAKEMMRKTQYN